MLMPAVCEPLRFPTGTARLSPRRTELDQLLDREELSKSGVYFLLGTNIDTGTPHAYIGEAEETPVQAQRPQGQGVLDICDRVPLQG